MKEGIGSYSLNLDKVQVGDKLGIMKASDSTLHFYLNGIDHGTAFTNLTEESATVTRAQVAIKKSCSFSGRPADWNVQTVCEFIESIPDCAPYVEKFRSEHVNGAALLELDKKDLKEFFKMPLGLAVNVCSHLKKYEEKINETHLRILHVNLDNLLPSTDFNDTQMLEYGTRKNPIDFENVLQFATGSTEEPVLGFTLHPSIDFVEVKQGSSFLPTANTCINTMQLPRPSLLINLHPQRNFLSFMIMLF
ncbi:unnamed protein product [Mytilus edulis]|uniref:SAM domain-containing protein n=1 Tax=Mytilus edulis TaxID=6550 RepID=A0A8S3RCL2_MYTED|nr:unnamed protein product [Mytilus edulis]